MSCLVYPLAMNADDLAALRAEIVMYARRSPDPRLTEYIPLAEVLFILDRAIEAEAVPSADLLQLAATLQPDVVLMDLHMPVMDGATATRHLLCHQPSCRVIMLTTFDDEDSRARGLGAGAVAYLLKDTSLDDLVEVIRGSISSPA